VLHCASGHHHLHGSIPGLDGSYEHDPKPDLTLPDQTRSENLGLCNEDVFNNTQLTQQIIFSVTFKFCVHQFHVMPSLVLRCLAGQAEALCSRS
jgi:hypothetical protein